MNGKQCPKCGSWALVFIDGVLVCPICGWNEKEEINNSNTQKPNQMTLDGRLIYA